MRNNNSVSKNQQNKEQILNQDNISILESMLPDLYSYAQFLSSIVELKEYQYRDDRSDYSQQLYTTLSTLELSKDMLNIAESLLSFLLDQRYDELEQFLSENKKYIIYLRSNLL